MDKRREELRVLGRQPLRSGISVAANWRGSSRSRSLEEFIAKAELGTQEADESQFWLELLRDDCGVAPNITDPMWKEADEPISIFVTMRKRAKENRSNTKS